MGPGCFPASCQGDRRGLSTISALIHDGPLPGGFWRGQGNESDGTSGPMVREEPVPANSPKEEGHSLSFYLALRSLGPKGPPRAPIPGQHSLPWCRQPSPDSVPQPRRALPRQLPAPSSGSDLRPHTHPWKLIFIWGPSDRSVHKGLGIEEASEEVLFSSSCPSSETGRPNPTGPDPPPGSGDPTVSSVCFLCLLGLRGGIGLRTGFPSLWVYYPWTICGNLGR